MLTDYAADSDSLESNFKAHPPRAQWELEAFMAVVHENQAEVRGWFISPMGYLEVAHNSVVQDAIPAIYLVATKGKIHQLKNELERIHTSSMGGYPPSRSDVDRIWNMLDSASSMH